MAIQLLAGGDRGWRTWHFSYIPPQKVYRDWDQTDPGAQNLYHRSKMSDSISSWICTLFRDYGTAQLAAFLVNLVQKGLNGTMNQTVYRFGLS